MRSPRSAADVPTTTPEAEALAKELKSQGYRFVGPTSVYAFMQNVGMVNDHIHGCFRAIDYQPPREHKSLDRAMTFRPVWGDGCVVLGEKGARRWTSGQLTRRGAVEIATYSNPPHNYLGQPVIDELGQLVTDWQDPAFGPS